MKKIALAILAICLVPFAAHAYSYTSVSFSNYYNSGKIVADGKFHGRMTTAAIRVGLTDDDGKTDYAKAFCVEPNVKAYSFTNGNLDVEFAAPSEVTGGLQAAWLVKNADKFNNGYSKAKKISALQTAVWEVISEDDGYYDLRDGSFKVLRSRGGVDKLANNLLQALAQNFDDADKSILNTSYAIALTPGYQNFIVEGVNASATPEPGTIALLGFGLLGIAALRRKTAK